MLAININHVMRLRGIRNPYTFLTANGFSHHTAYRLAHDKCKSLHLGHLEKLCRILRCEPHDLLAYTAQPNAPVGMQDHLAFLTRTEAPVIDLDSIMRSLPLAEAITLGKQLAERLSRPSA